MQLLHGRLRVETPPSSVSPRVRGIGFETMQFVQDVAQPSLGKDQFCPACGYRLAFLRLVADSRERAAG